MFRLKIALLSVLLSGLVLTGLGFHSLDLMNKVGLDRIDREILSLGQGHLSVAPPREYWQNFEKSLAFIYREDRAQDLIVLIKDPGGEVLYRSPHWPSEITEDAFPAFDRTMDTRPRAGAVQSVIPAAEAQERRPAPQGGALDDHGGPPAEASAACSGKSAGSRSQFADARGETLSGTCEDDGTGRMVLRPDRNRRGPDERPAGPPPGQEHSERPLPKIKRPEFATIETSAGPFRVGIMGSERITMLAGMNLAEYYADAKRFRRAFAATVPVSLLLLAAGGWIIAQRALRPVSLITRTAERITARALDQRVPAISADRELSRLTDVINGMLDRLEKSFGQAVRFSADAAHELQTPLTVLQGELDEAVRLAADGSDEQRRAGSLLEEMQRLKSIVQKLLVLARADAGRLELHLAAVDLSALVVSAAEDAAAMAPHLTVEQETAPNVVVNADRDLLRQVISNLMSNAVKYNRENGRIRFRLVVRDKKAFLSVANTGIPIPLSDRDLIFDRFYRVDRSRSRSVAGSGLGLSLAREIAVAHHGDLRLDPPSDDMISFTLSLPCSRT